MLATRPRREDAEDEERVPLTAASSTFTDTSLFEGLSFPEVPKTVISRNTTSSSSNYRLAPIVDSNDMEMVTFSEVPSAPPQLGYVGEPVIHPFTRQEETTSPFKNQLEQPQRVKGSLSTLYATTEVSHLSYWLKALVLICCIYLSSDYRLSRLRVKTP